MYCFESRVRYSEVDVGQRLTIDGIVNYFQDTSSFQSEDLGVGIDYLKEIQKVWVVSSWQIVVSRYPKFGERIVVRTWPYDFKGFYGFRNFTIEDEHGVVAYANSVWVYMDLVQNKPVKTTADMYEKYILKEKYNMEYLPRKVAMPQNLEIKQSFVVKESHIDTNQHVNNGQYIQMAKEHLPEAFLVEQMRVEYKKEAVLGAVIVPKVGQQENKYTVALCNEENIPYAMIEFIGGIRC